MAESNRIKVLFSIIGRGKSKKYMEMLGIKGIGFHIQATALGTAPSEMMDIFGLGTNDKDIVISLAPSTLIDSYMTEISGNFGVGSKYNGIAMSLRLSAITRLTSEIVTRASRINSETEGNRTVKDNTKNQLILISVNQGYTDQVMQTAKAAGAMGGTILRARLADAEKVEHFGDAVIQDEKEIITILAPSSTAAKIMEEVNKAHGFTTEARGMIMALPVDKAYKI